LTLLHRQFSENLRCAGQANGKVDRPLGLGYNLERATRIAKSRARTAGFDNPAGATTGISFYTHPYTVVKIEIKPQPGFMQSYLHITSLLRGKKRKFHENK